MFSVNTSLITKGDVEYDSKKHKDQKQKENLRCLTWDQHQGLMLKVRVSRPNFYL